MQTMILDDNNEKYKRIHFIGIGGVSMNGLAQILKAAGYIVSGSDQNESAITRQLSAAGIDVFIGHRPENIAAGTDLVVYTAAVKTDNIELSAAREKGVAVMDRASLLGLLMKNYTYPICVAGTHGKTTTTAMAAEVFLAAEKDPTVLVGGYLQTIGGTLLNGGREYMVVESCEYFDSFLKFFPFVGIILNLEADHLDYFKDLAAVRASFHHFARRIPGNGWLVINAEIERTEELTADLACKTVTFGLADADWTAENIVYDENGCPSFDAVYLGEKRIRIALSVQGRHNILNALSVAAAAFALGIDLAAIAGGLRQFHGANRRFQFKGKQNGITVIDDYAHHPTEIKATVEAAKNIAANQKWFVFQPHTHSRTKSLLKEFSECFDDADKIIILDIYSPAGREEKSTHIHSRDLVGLIKARGKEVYYKNSFDEAEKFLKENCLHNDMLITMGAGDVFRLGERMLDSGVR